MMLYLAYPAPHTPWLPDPEYVGASKAGMYGDFLVMVDAMIGRVLKSIDDHGMADNTLLIFTSDNGPVWFESDVERFGHDASGGLRGMKADAWECGHRMPFLVRWPGKVKAASVTDQTICFTDLLATFASIVDAELSAEAKSLAATCGKSPLAISSSKRLPPTFRQPSVAITKSPSGEACRRVASNVPPPGA